MSEDWNRAQCADYWGIDPDTWSAYVSRGRAPTPYMHVGRTPLWDEDDVRDWPRPGQGTRNDIVMPDELPVLYETTHGTRGDTTGPIPPLPRYWHVAVADRAPRGDTYIEVMRPDGQAVASVAWTGRLNEGSEELAEAVAWITRAARKIWDAGPKLTRGTPPAALWADVSEAWEFAGRGAYFAWAGHVASLGVTTPAAL